MKLKPHLQQLRDVLKLLLPENKSEWIVFLFFFAIYLSYSVFIALNTSIIDSIERPYDIYLGYDNPIVYERGYVYISGHPLMKYMIQPFILLGDLLASILGCKAKTLLSTFICSSLISLSIVYVFKYLKNIINLTVELSFILIGIYGFSMTCLTLCFTPESFTISAFLLSFTVYFYSFYIQQDKHITLLTNILFPVLLGGVTITNFSKGLVPLLFLKKDKKIITKDLLIICFVFLVILVFVILDLRGQLLAHFINNTTTTTAGTDFEDLFGMLFSSPIFSSTVALVDYPDGGSLPYMIAFEYYTHWWQYLFSGILFLMILISIVCNYKNKLVHMLLLFICVDVFIHVIMRFGMGEGFLYGAHWLFFVPIILGWGYKSITSSQVGLLFKVILVLLLISLMINNITQLIRFINLAILNFPPYLC